MAIFYRLVCLLKSEVYPNMVQAVINNKAHTDCHSHTPINGHTNVSHPNLHVFWTTSKDIHSNVAKYVN